MHRSRDRGRRWGSYQQLRSIPAAAQLARERAGGRHGSAAARFLPDLGCWPLSAHGAAVVVAPHPDVSLAVVAISANDRPDKYGSPGGSSARSRPRPSWICPWKIGDLPGTARPAFAWTSKNPVAVDNPFLVPALVLGLQVPSKSSNWVVNLNLEQYVFMPEGESPPKLHTATFDFEPEGIGVFFRFTHAPEDRNPWNTFVSGGIGGRGVVPSRPNDRYGLGFYAFIESDDLKNQPILGGLLDTEWGMEIFYNVAITPWLQLTPDLQYIQSGLPGVSDSVVLAMRIQMYF